MAGSAAFVPVPLPDEGGHHLQSASVPGSTAAVPPRHGSAKAERHPPRRPPAACCRPTVPPPACAAEAGSLWRGEKLRDFAFRLKCLGLDQDPQFAALASQIAEQTQALEQLAERQAQPDYQRPWWQDGEYDASRADRWVQ
jgi:hypothetical protein